MKTLADYIREADKEGQPRSGIILGLRMVLLALKELGISDPAGNRRDLIAFVETDRCLPDAVELVTGCRLGNRTLKFKDLGKMAATFVDLRTNRAIRIAARESANQQALERFPGLEKEKALQHAYRIFSDEILLTRQWVSMDVAEADRPGYRAPRVVCSACGEGIAFGREVRRGGHIVCRTCAGAPYWKQP